MNLKSLVVKSIFCVGMLAMSGMFFEINAQSLIGEWQLMKMKVNKNQTILNEKNLPTITFNTKGNANGSGGCNRYFISYKLNKKKNSILFTSGGSTKMACIDEIAMMIESNYLRILEKMTQYSVSGNTLTLSDENSFNELKFTKFKNKPATASKNKNRFRY